MTKLALEFLGVFGLPPVPFVDLAAKLGCPHITTVLEPIGCNPHGYPHFSLREDQALRRDFVAAMRQQGVSLSLGEGIGIHAGADVRAAAGDLELMRELGITRINVVCLEPDLGRAFDQLAVLTELAADFGMETLLEFVPIFTIADLPTALDALRHVGRPDCRLTIDTMHFFRSGAKVSDLDPALVGYIQLCDVPLAPVIADYMEEAMYERRAPGDGDLPLLDLLRAVPRDRVVGLEIPLRAEAEAGIGPQARMGRCVEAARALLARLPEPV